MNTPSAYGYIMLYVLVPDVDKPWHGVLWLVFTTPDVVVVAVLGSPFVLLCSWSLFSIFILVFVFLFYVACIGMSDIRSPP